MSKEFEILKTKNRINLLTERQPLKENQSIVKKLERKLRQLQKENN